MSINSALQGWSKGITRPDWTVIGKRVVIGDGVNPNQVYDGFSGNTRILGAYPHYDPIVTLAIIPDPPLDPGTGGDGLLMGGTGYKYGCRWKVTDQKGREERSAMTFVDYRNSSPNITKLKLTFRAYVYPPQSGATWTVKMEIYRSKYGESGLLLYRIPIDTADDVTGTNLTYTDQTRDDELVLSDTVDLSLSEQNTYFPPCNYVRNWQHRLVMCGNPNYNLGQVFVGAGHLDRVRLIPGDSLANVREVDRYARLKISGQSADFVVDDVDTTSKYWTITPDATATSAKNYYIWRDQAIYVGKPLPEDPESFVLDDIIYTDKEDVLTGLAVASGYCYIFWERSIAILAGQSGAWQVLPVRNGIGCASHATLTDRNSDLIFFYAGVHGVWVLAGGEVRKISQQIDPVFATEINHTMNRWTHGIFDPASEMYFLWVFSATPDIPITTKTPDLLLMYDNRNGQWYMGNLPATSSAMLHRSGRYVPCVTLSGHLAEITPTLAYDGYAITKSGLGSTFSATGITGLTGLPTTDNGLQGIPVTILSYSTDENANREVLVRRVIAENTSTAITINGTWGYSFVAGTTYTICIGNLRWYAEYDFSGFAPGNLQKLNYEAQGVVDPVGTVEDPNYVALESIAVHDATNYDRVQITTTFTAEDANDMVEIRAGNSNVRGRAIKVRIGGVSKYFNRVRMLGLNMVNKRRE